MTVRRTKDTREPPMPPEFAAILEEMRGHFAVYGEKRSRDCD